MQPGESLDDLQLAGLRILQKERSFRFGMDAVLLADFARVEDRDRCADFGTGTGILPLLLAGRGKGRTGVYQGKRGVSLPKGTPR